MTSLAPRLPSIKILFPNVQPSFHYSDCCNVMRGKKVLLTVKGVQYEITVKQNLAIIAWQEPKGFFFFFPPRKLFRACLKRVEYQQPMEVLPHSVYEL